MAPEGQPQNSIPPVSAEGKRLMTQAYPLQWPQGRPRTASPRTGRFSKTTRTRQGWDQKVELTVADAVGRLQDEIDRLGARQYVLSTNLELRLDGLPRSSQAEPRDPGEVGLLPGHLHVEHATALDIANDKPGASGNDLLVHAQNPRQIELVMGQSLFGMVFEDPADQALLDPVQVRRIGEGSVDRVLGKLIPEANGHEPIRVNAGKVFEQDRAARPAPVSLAGDAQVGGLSLDRMVLELNLPLPVLDHIGIAAGAGRNAGLIQFHVNEQGSIDLFERSREVSLQTQQVPADQTSYSLQWGAAA
jgi:hypothetical protein